MTGRAANLAAISGDEDAAQPARIVTEPWTRRRYQIVIVAIAGLTFAASLALYRTIFPLYSADADEGVYVFQARMLLRGKVTLPAHTYGEFFRPWLSGERNGRIFTDLQVGLPAFLAASQRVLGSMRVGVALVAALTVVSSSGFALELLGDRRVAIMSGCFLALSPLFLMQSALILTYVLSLFGLTSAGWALLRATHSGRTRDLMIGGLALGITLLTRPFDAVLFGGPLLALTLFRLTREQPWRSAFGRMSVRIAVGLAPFVAATLWYNWQATGSALSFPINAADPLNTFGFGQRRLIVTEGPISYTFGVALRELRGNIHVVPGWVFGGLLMLGLAGFGLWVIRRRVEAIFLVAIGAAFPLGYVFWWATVLSAATGKNLTGPVYYLPAFIPLVILGAVGCVRLAHQRGLIVGGLIVAALVAITAWQVPDKVHVNRAITVDFERGRRLVPAHLDNALVFLHTNAQPYLLAKFPFFQTDPDLSGRIVYAVDKGAADAQLISRMPSRRAYRLRQELEPNDQLFSPTGGFTEIHALSASRVALSVRPLVIPVGLFARAYVSDGTIAHYVDLHASDIANHTMTTWNVNTNETTTASSTGVTLKPDRSGQLLVGIETANNAAFTRPDRRESRIEYTTTDGRITLITPGLGWALYQFSGHSGLWLAADVSPSIDVQAVPL